VSRRGATRATCECFISYEHISKLGVRDGHDADGFLARIRRPAVAGDAFTRPLDG